MVRYKASIPHDLRERLGVYQRKGGKYPTRAAALKEARRRVRARTKEFRKLGSITKYQLTRSVNFGTPMWQEDISYKRKRREVWRERDIEPRQATRLMSRDIEAYYRGERRLMLYYEGIMVHEKAYKKGHRPVGFGGDVSDKYTMDEAIDHAHDKVRRGIYSHGIITVYEFTDQGLLMDRFHEHWGDMSELYEGKLAPKEE